MGLLALPFSGFGLRVLLWGVIVSLLRWSVDPENRLIPTLFLDNAEHPQEQFVLSHRFC